MLGQCENESRKLQEEIRDTENQNRENTRKMIKDKEKENTRLHEKILDLENRIASLPKRDKLVDEVVNIINEKDSVVNEINDITKKLRTDVNDENYPEIEEEYQSILRNIVSADDKLNSLLDHLQSLKQNEDANTNEMLRKLKKVENQYDNDVNVLKRETNYNDDTHVKDPFKSVPSAVSSATSNRPQQTFDIPTAVEPSIKNVYPSGLYSIPCLSSDCEACRGATPLHHHPHQLTEPTVQLAEEPKTLQVEKPPGEKTKEESATVPRDHDIVIKCEHFWAKPRFKKVKADMQPRIVHHIADRKL